MNLGVDYASELWSWHVAELVVKIDNRGRRI